MAQSYVISNMRRGYGVRVTNYLKQPRTIAPTPNPTLNLIVRLCTRFMYCPIERRGAKEPRWEKSYFAGF